MRFLIKPKLMTQYFYHVNTSGHRGLYKSSDSCLLAKGGGMGGQVHLMDRKQPHGRLGFRDTPWWLNSDLCARTRFLNLGPMDTL